LTQAPSIDSGRASMNSGQIVRAWTERVETLMERIEPRAQVEELVQTLLVIYGEGLSRILKTIAESVGGERIIETLCSDQFVASLLLVHDLHPVRLEERIERALDGVRPYIHSHGGEVAVAGIHDGIVELRLSGTCNGCPASSATMKLSVERAIFAVAPEVLEVRAT
jgi:Fe-S cluster biogenesis protein NfuA